MMMVEIFSGPQCAYCEQAKRLLDEKEISYQDYDISEAVHMQEFAERLPRTRSIPQIFIDGEHIGNEEDLKALALNGRFNTSLK